MSLAQVGPQGAGTVHGRGGDAGTVVRTIDGAHTVEATPLVEAMLAAPPGAVPREVRPGGGFITVVLR